MRTILRSLAFASPGRTSSARWRSDSPDGERHGSRRHVSTEAYERHVLEVMMLQDPSGYPIEIFHGPHVQADKPSYPGRRMHGRFKTGDGGLGH